MRLNSMTCLVLATALGLGACAKKPTTETGTEAPVAADRDDHAATMPAASAPALERPAATPAEQAATLLRYLEDRPDCQAFRAPLEQARQAPPGTPVTFDMAQIMDEAYKAGCQKPSGG